MDMDMTVSNFGGILILSMGCFPRQHFRDTCVALLVLLDGLCSPAAAALLQIDQSKSRIEVAVNSTVSSFTGKLEKYQAAIECDLARPLPTNAQVTFDFKDLKTGVAGRDEHMLKWLQYSKNPKASFYLTDWKRNGEESLAQGQLTIHGVQRTIQIPVIVKRQNDTYDIEGAVSLDYRDFGLPRIRSALVFSVDPRLKIKFHLLGKIGD
jgi:polyisoprenoid-binding protein YceI